MNILLVGHRHHHRLFIVYYFKYIINDKSIPILRCWDFLGKTIFSEQT